MWFSQFDKFQDSPTYVSQILKCKNRKGDQNEKSKISKQQNNVALKEKKNVIKIDKVCVT